MDHGIIYNKKLFLTEVTEKLGTNPIDYPDRTRTINEARNSSNGHLRAGVLLLLFFRENNFPAINGEGEFFFRLIKRSHRVAQAGDLACPGGMLDAKWDLPIARLITSGLLPLFRNKAGRHLQQRDSSAFHAAALFLATSVREAWEEIRLNPFQVHFLGPLPSHRLRLYPRTIFPLAGYVESRNRFRPNDEVERIVDIPVQAFFREENYGTLTLNIDGDLHVPANDPESFPCFLYRDQKGKDNLLWGATFYIIINFLKIVLDFQIPKWQEGFAVNKTIDANYLSGGR